MIIAIGQSIVVVITLVIIIATGVVFLHLSPMLR
jgi:hypothetical protein